MINGLLLTDDEAIALAAVTARPWPTALATVESTPEALQEAGIRGIRALAVRGLLTGDPASESGFTIHPELNSAILGFLTAARHVGAYLAPADEPDRLAGASITAGVADSHWWLVSTTAQGVHGIRSASRLEVLDVVADFAEKTHDGTLLAGAKDPTAYACVIRWGGADDHKLVVPGNAASAGLQWDRTPLVESFGAAFG